MRSTLILAITTVFGLLAFSQSAYATKKVYNPYVEEHELELEWRGGFTHDDEDDEADGAWEQKAAVGYGFTNWFFGEIYGEFEKEGDDDDVEFSAIELEGKFQLTERGQFWVDVGLLAEYEINTLSGPDKIEGKLLLSKDIGKFSHTANIALETEVGDDAEHEVEAGLSWSTRYRYKEEFEPGFEIHSEFGPIDDPGGFDEESHQIGPVVYGKVGNFKYDVGYLFGVSDGAPDGEVKGILEYEWHF